MRSRSWSSPSFVKGFGRTSSIPARVVSAINQTVSGGGGGTRAKDSDETKERHTVHEIALDIVSSNVGCHCHNGRPVVKSPNHLGRGAAVEMGHHDIHKHEVIVVVVHLVDGNETIIL